MVLFAKNGLKIASQSKLGLVRAYIRCPSLLELSFVCKRIKFPEQFCSEENQRKGRVDYGIGLLRRYSTSIGAGSERKFISKSCTAEVDSVFMNKSFFYSKALHKRKNPISTIYKVREELNGGSISNPLMSSMSNAKKELPVDIETEDMEELTDIKEGDIINLCGLLFTENRDYLVKYNDEKVGPCLRCVLHSAAFFVGCAAQGPHDPRIYMTLYNTTVGVGHVV